MMKSAKYIPQGHKKNTELRMNSWPLLGGPRGHRSGRHRARGNRERRRSLEPAGQAACRAHRIPQKSEAVARSRALRRHCTRRACPLRRLPRKACAHTRSEPLFKHECRAVAAHGASRCQPSRVRRSRCRRGSRPLSFCLHPSQRATLRSSSQDQSRSATKAEQQEVESIPSASPISSAAEPIFSWIFPLSAARLW